MPKHRESIEGVARHVDRPESFGSYVVRLRLEELDEQGSAVRLVPVQLERYRDSPGRVADGDRVRAEGTISKAGVLEADTIHNLTTGERISSQSNPVKGLAIGAVVVLALLLAAVAIWFSPIRFG